MSSERKVLDFLTLDAAMEFTFPYSSKDIAELLGLTSNSVSSALRKLLEEGKVQIVKFSGEVNIYPEYTISGSEYDPVHIILENSEEYKSLDLITVSEYYRKYKIRGDKRKSILKKLKDLKAREFYTYKNTGRCKKYYRKFSEREITKVVNLFISEGKNMFRRFELTRKEVSERVINFLNENKNNYYTVNALAKELSLTPSQVRKSVKILLDNKDIKIVDFECSKSLVTPRYQSILGPHEPYPILSYEDCKNLKLSSIEKFLKAHGKKEDFTHKSLDLSSFPLLVHKTDTSYVRVFPIAQMNKLLKKKNKGLVKNKREVQTFLDKQANAYPTKCFSNSEIWKNLRISESGINDVLKVLLSEKKIKIVEFGFDRSYYPLYQSIKGSLSEKEILLEESENFPELNLISASVYCKEHGLAASMTSKILQEAKSLMIKGIYTHNNSSCGYFYKFKKTDLDKIIKVLKEKDEPEPVQEVTQEPIPLPDLQAKELKERRGLINLISLWLTSASKVGLSHNANYLMTHLLDNYDYKKRCIFISQQALSDKSKLGLATVKRVLNELIQADLITKIRKREGNSYELTEKFFMLIGDSNKNSFKHALEFIQRNNLVMQPSTEPEPVQEDNKSEYISKELIRQRTKEALANLKAQGVTLGRPKRVMPENFKDLYEEACDSSNNYTHVNAMKDLGLKKTTYYELIKDLKKAEEVQPSLEPKPIQEATLLPSTPSKGKRYKYPRSKKKAPENFKELFEKAENGGNKFTHKMVMNELGISRNTYKRMAKDLGLESHKKPTGGYRLIPIPSNFQELFNKAFNRIDGYNHTQAAEELGLKLRTYWNIAQKTKAVEVCLGLSQPSLEPEPTQEVIQEVVQEPILLPDLQAKELKERFKPKDLFKKVFNLFGYKLNFNVSIEKKKTIANIGQDIIEF